MLRYMFAAILTVALCGADAFAAGPTPQPAKATTLKLTQGAGCPNGTPCVTRTLPVVPPCLKCTFTDVTQSGQRKIGGGSLGGNWAQFPTINGPVGTDWVYPPTQCPAIPPDASQTVDCAISNPGTHGLWTQTHGWTQAPFPGCGLTARPWTPATAPVDACTTTPPPPQLNVDLSYVDLAGRPFQRFKFYNDTAIDSNGSDFDLRSIDLIYMYRITGDQRYSTAAIANVDAMVAKAEADIAAGINPDVADDSYLGVGENIAGLAMTFAWANPLLTASQKTRWAAYANATIFNVWNASAAHWGSRPAPWSSWSTENPYNNYFYSFIQATMTWALASGSLAIVHDGKTALQYLQTDRMPLLSNAYAVMAGGGSKEGTGYGLSHRSLFEIWQIWRDSGQGDLRNAHMTNSIDFWVHATVPTFDRVIPIGDQSRVSEPWVYDYHRALLAIAAYITDAPAERALSAYWFANLKNGDGSPYDEDQNTYSLRYDLIPHATAVTPVALTYRAPEVGAVFARSGWNTDATLFSTLMGPYSESHAHHEQGGFTIFGARGWQAVTLNIWSHSGIQQATTGKNVIRFERSGQAQEQIFDRAVTVSNYTANPTTGTTHIVGDMTPMYASGVVTSWVRTEDYDGHNSATITDALTLPAGTSAIFQLQLPSTPTVAGNVITTPHFRATVLQPAGAQITIVPAASIDNDYSQGARVDIRGPGVVTAYKVQLDVMP